MNDMNHPDTPEGRFWQPETFPAIAYVTPRIGLDIKTIHIERIVIECSMERATQAKRYLWDHGYEIRWSGPKKLDIMRYDSSCFEAMGEKELP